MLFRSVCFFLPVIDELRFAHVDQGYVNLTALNDTAPEDIRNTNLLSQNFGEGFRHISPRRAMIGIKFAY